MKRPLSNRMCGFIYFGHRKKKDINRFLKPAYGIERICDKERKEKNENEEYAKEHPH